MSQFYRCDAEGCGAEAPKLCECGCGHPAPIARQTCAQRGWIKGRPIRFIRGHHTGWKGAASFGAKRVNSDGYVQIPMRDHPNADRQGYVLEHVAVAAKALGRPVPKGAVVHHVNGNKKDNRPENLVLCPDASYHQLIHARQDALLACGNANWRKCCFCHTYDSLDNLTIRASSRRAVHLRCESADRRKRVAARKLINANQ